LPNADNDNGPFWMSLWAVLHFAMGRFGQCNGPFWTIFLEIKIFGAVLVGAVLAMGRFGIDPLLQGGRSTSALY